MKRLFSLVVGVLMAVAGAAAPPAQAQDFAVTDEVPTLEELTSQLQLLVATQAPDHVKAAQLEGGSRALIVPKMVYRLGVLRAPRGYVEVTGPETHEEGRHTAVINGHRQGSPTIVVPAEWRFIDGRWKLASKSMCNGISALGLPIPCNFQ
ncbi:hypothetical protein [Mycolicibacterium smegmatis]|uniref:hypothetical protein n=1 Tax=Mycolicibacterium smegmatis TaxID=1772 RepID=UPI001303A73F|nr:hypothetical protein [Mycolicibacterium smegmatis]